MSSAPERYYHPAGTVPFAGTIAMLALGSVGAVLFSFIYALVLNYVTIDKIMFLAAMCVGFGIGGFVRGGALLAGVTSRVFSALVAMFCGLLGCYLTWVWDIWILTEWNFLSFNPLDVLGTLIEINQNGGIWEDSPTGIWLWLLWLVEVLMITGISVGITLIPFRPYCHACRRWTEELPARCVLRRSGISELQASLEEEQYEVLDQLSEGEIDAASHCEVSLMKCPNCDESDYLTVAEIDVAVNKKGEASVQRKEVIRHLLVPEEVVDQVAGIASRQASAVQELDAGGGEATEDEPA
jgi:hypothetical protein